MSSPITYPPGQISLYGIQQALVNEFTWITYVGCDGSIWHLAGPGAPVAGAQNGVVLTQKGFMGLMAPFEMLEQRGARQDGATWQAAVYDAGEMMINVEISGLTPQDTRDTFRQWISAWDPRKTGILSIFTPDFGEWWCEVRAGKNLSDIITQDYTWSGRVNLAMEVKNYNAFWQSIDSTSSFPPSEPGADALNFTAMDDASSLTGFNQIYSTEDGGTSGIVSGAAQIIPAGTTSMTVTNLFETPSGTDYQLNTVQFSPAPWANIWQQLEDLWELYTNPSDENAGVQLWCRASEDGTSGVYVNLGYQSFEFISLTAGESPVVLYSDTYSPILWGDTFQLVAGVSEANSREFQLLLNGSVIMDYTDSASQTPMGADNRYFGFGQSTYYDGTQILIPFPIAQWSGQDQSFGTIQGWMPLTNRGDVDAWPRFLVYGPGTFTFGNGPGVQQQITFGPLLPGQIVLVTTDPQYRSVVDLSPVLPQSQPQTLNLFQQLMDDLISFATNGNTPPLLAQFESVFNILPPQGNLYQLLNGRFTNPIPGNSYGTVPQEVDIFIQVEGVGTSTRVVAAVTPQRRWPL